MFLSNHQRQVLVNVIENSDTPAGKAFDYAVECLIILSLVTFSIETIPDLSQWMKNLLWYTEIMTVLLFTVEYLLRIIVADRKLHYVFSFYGITDLLAILPFYVAHGLDLRAVRVFRLMRLVRILKLARYNTAMIRFHKAFLIARDQLILFSIVTVMLIYVAAVGIYYFERDAQPEQFKSVFHSLWWAVATLTTVGYGDVYPVTAGGKAFTFFVLMIGLGIVAVPAGMVASALSEARRTSDSERNGEPHDFPP